MSNQALSAGSFCWNELATKDAATSREFYSKLFGWETQEMPMPGDGSGIYVLFKLDGKDIGGCYQLDGPEFEGIPPHWAAYVSVDDVDAKLRKAEERGGSVLWPAIDVPGVGRMGGFADPSGAALNVMTLGDTEERPDLGNAHGFFCWNELATDDTEKAADFYSTVLGWGVDKKEAGPMPYTEWTVADKSVGGMLAIDPSWGPVPPHWTIYISVESCDATLARAKELGGEVIVPPVDMLGVGRFAGLADPCGVHFSIITLSEGHDG